MTASGKQSILRMGNFDSERFWRDDNLAQLPGIPDKAAERIVCVMDEMLFSTCESTDDVLLTRLPLQTAHRQYLQDIGFRFTNNDQAVSDPQAQLTNEAMCGLLREHREQAYFCKLLKGVSSYAPYSLLPTTADFCRHYMIPADIPATDTVIQVNSKLYSHQLAVDALDEVHGEVVESAAELAEAGNRLLTDGAFLVKDDFGVSGKGNLLIESPQLLERIVHHLQKLETKGKQTRFLLEPLLDKELDFSCQLHISPDGAVEIVSVQQMDNAGFAFSAIRTADQAFMEHLEQSGYLKRMETIAARLYQAGYFGPVCVDSMLLRNGDIRSIVEINARQSMGFINHYLDRFLQAFGRKGSLLFFSLGLQRGISFETLLERMQGANLLFSTRQPQGVLPLSANTLTVNQPEEPDNNSVFKGRLYVSLVADSPAQQSALKQQMQRLFSELGIKLYN